VNGDKGKMLLGDLLRRPSMLIPTCIANKTERQRRMYADDLIPEPMASITHAITIDALPVEVWPWLLQMGAGRAGWYSWDFIDNGGVRSARSILAEFQNVEVGQIFPAIPGAEDVFVLQALAPKRHLVLCVPSASEEFLVSWEFTLESLDDNLTRLIVRGRIAENWLTDIGGQIDAKSGPILIERVYGILAIIPRWIMLPLAWFGHRIMEARMLRGIKRRVESTEH
jgi:hypothetical protein